MTEVTAETMGERAAERVERVGRTRSRRGMQQRRARVKAIAKVHMTAMMMPIRISETQRVSRGVKAAARTVKERKVERTRKRLTLTRWMTNWTNTLAKSLRNGTLKTAN